MILDQVSAKQNVHHRVVGRIHELLDKDLSTMAQMLISDTDSVSVLRKETVLNIDFDAVLKSGVSFIADPFFRGILFAFYQVKLSKLHILLINLHGCCTLILVFFLGILLFKTKIELPANCGRTMFGVLDETGSLEYGQVFIQYSENIKKPGKDITNFTGK